MKGLIKILESIIASVILLASLSFFFGMNFQQANDPMLLIYAKDSIAAIHKNGSLIDYIKNNDITKLNKYFRNVLPENTKFSIDIIGIPKPNIRISCNCSEEQKNELEAMLSPLTFTYKQRTIQLSIKENEPITSPDTSADILFLFGYTNLSKYKENINEFLGKGKTIIILSNLTLENINDGVMNNIFGLSFAASDGSTSGIFYSSDPFHESYWVSDIYNLTDKGTFTLYPNPVGVDENTILSNPTRTNSFVKVNVLPKGQTVWFSEYEHSNNNVNLLLKTMILWSTTKGYSMDENDMSYFKDLVPSFVTASRFVFGSEDFKESFIIKMSIWKIFF